MTADDSRELTDRAKWVLDKAREMPAISGQPCIGCEHIAIALLKAPGPTTLSQELANRGIDVAALVLDLERAIQITPEP